MSVSNAGLEHLLDMLERGVPRQPLTLQSSPVATEPEMSSGSRLVHQLQKAQRVHKLNGYPRRHSNADTPLFLPTGGFDVKVFVHTGAGISAESGLGTFRDKAGEGIWSRFDPLKLATPEAFAADPDAVHAFYNARRQNLLGASLSRRRRSVANRAGGGWSGRHSGRVAPCRERLGSKSRCVRAEVR